MSKIILYSNIYAILRFHMYHQFLTTKIRITFLRLMPLCHFNFNFIHKSRNARYDCVLLCATKRFYTHTFKSSDRYDLSNFLSHSFTNDLVILNRNLVSRGVRFRLKVGQIGNKRDNPGMDFLKIQFILARRCLYSFYESYIVVEEVARFYIKNINLCFSKEGVAS